MNRTMFYALMESGYTIQESSRLLEKEKETPMWKKAALATAGVTGAMALGGAGRKLWKTRKNLGKMKWGSIGKTALRGAKEPFQYVGQKAADAADWAKKQYRGAKKQFNAGRKESDFVDGNLEEGFARSAGRAFGAAEKFVSGGLKKARKGGKNAVAQIRSLMAGAGKKVRSGYRKAAKVAGEYGASAMKHGRAGMKWAGKHKKTVAAVGLGAAGGGYYLTRRKGRK